MAGADPGPRVAVNSLEPVVFAAKLDVAARALKRLAVVDEFAGMGDVQDPEGLARIRFARRTLAALGLDLEQRFSSQ